MAYEKVTNSSPKGEEFNWGSGTPDSRNGLGANGFATSAMRTGLFGMNYGGGKNLTAFNFTRKPEDPSEPPENPSRYYGPNYTAQRNAIKAAADRNAPLLINQYNDAISDAARGLEDQQALLDDNLANAKNTFNANMAAQRKLNEDTWYSFTQRLQNSRMQHNDDYNTGLNGSTLQRMNDLYNLADDQFDQTNLTNLKQGYQQYFQNLMDVQNNDINRYNENLDQTYQNIRDLLRQGSSALSNYANDVLAQLAAYDDRGLQTANGDLTQAGWDWLSKFGITNDGTGKYAFDESFLGKDVWQDAGSWDNWFDGLRDMKKGLVNADYLPMVRSAAETNRFRQDQSGTTQKSYSNATYNKLYYGEELSKRYG